jgi:hypothetical protein
MDEKIHSGHANFVDQAESRNSHFLRPRRWFTSIRASLSFRSSLKPDMVILRKELDGPSLQET